MKDENYTHDQLKIINSLNSEQEAINYGKTFFYAQAINENDQNGLYATFIEERRLREQEKFKELQELTERTEAEQKKMEAYATSKLSSAEYFSINWSKPNNIEDFFALHPETEEWKETVDADLRARTNKITKEFSKTHPEVAKERVETDYQMAAVLDKMGEVFESKAAKRTLDATRMLINPVGFFAGKAVAKILTSALKTEQGQNLISGMKNMWEKKFGKSMGIKNKGLKAAAIGGIVTVVGASALVLGVDPSDFKETFDIVKDSLPDLEIEPMGVQPVDPTNPYVQQANHYLTSATAEVESSKDAFLEKAIAAKDVDLSLEEQKNIDYFLKKVEIARAEMTIPDVSEPDERAMANMLKAEQMMGDVTGLDTDTLSADGADGQELTEENDLLAEQGVEKDAPENVSQDSPKVVAQPESNFPDAFVIKEGDKLELLVKEAMPEGTKYEDIQEMVLKIAEHNGLQDADKIYPGQTLEMPGLNSPAPEMFKIDEAKDLFALDKVPYGSEITPTEYKEQVGQVLKEMYPNEPTRVHEMMAHVNAQMNGLPANQPIPSGTKIGLGDEYVGYLKEKSFAISDEQESLYPSLNDDGTLKELENEVQSKTNDSPTQERKEVSRYRNGR